MFYSTQILAKKGPLGTIWIAAHLDRRLKRSQVFEANIASSVGAFFFGKVDENSMSCGDDDGKMKKKASIWRRFSVASERRLRGALLSLFNDDGAGSVK